VSTSEIPTINSNSFTVLSARRQRGKARSTAKMVPKLAGLCRLVGLTGAAIGIVRPGLRSRNYLVERFCGESTILPPSLESLAATGSPSDVETMSTNKAAALSRSNATSRPATEIVMVAV